MISINDLRALAKARLEDADVLARNDRLDGAQYLCGYSVEFTLKARICATLNWSDFPETRKEFENFGSFKTHKLDVLLQLSGQEKRVKSDHFWEWSAVAPWDPETRYKPVGQSELIDVVLMLHAAKTFMDIL